MNPSSGARRATSARHQLPHRSARARLRPLGELPRAADHGQPVSGVMHHIAGPCCFSAGGPPPHRPLAARRLPRRRALGLYGWCSCCGLPRRVTPVSNACPRRTSDGQRARRLRPQASHVADPYLRHRHLRRGVAEPPARRGWSSSPTPDRHGSGFELGTRPWCGEKLRTAQTEHWSVRPRRLDGTEGVAARCLPAFISVTGIVLGNPMPATALYAADGACWHRAADHGQVGALLRRARHLVAEHTGYATCCC